MTEQQKYINELRYVSVTIFIGFVIMTVALFKERAKKPIVKLVPVQDPPYVPDKASSVAVEPQRTLEDLLDAIEWIESKGDPNAIGDSGAAIGAYQIHKIYVDDCNRIIGETYFNYHDRWSRVQSRHMAITYLSHYGKGRSLEDIARIHNGGPNGYKKISTKKYWLKIKNYLDNLQ